MNSTLIGRTLGELLWAYSERSAVGGSRKIKLQLVMTARKLRAKQATIMSGRAEEREQRREKASVQVLMTERPDIRWAILASQHRRGDAACPWLETNPACHVAPFVPSIEIKDF